MRKTSKNGCLDAHFSTARGSRASCSRSESTYSPALAPLGFGRSNNPRRVASAMSKKVALLAYGRCWRKSFQQLWQTIRRADTIRRRLRSCGSPLFLTPPWRSGQESDDRRVSSVTTHSRLRLRVPQEELRLYGARIRDDPGERQNGRQHGGTAYIRTPAPQLGTNALPRHLPIPPLIQ